MAEGVSMTATDLSRLLRAVLESPGDDDVRLIYADALDEAGQGDRADLIRWQVETGVEFVRDPERSRWRNKAAPGVRDFPPSGWRALNGFLSEFLPRPFVVGRGFVEAISLPADAFLAHAGAIFAAHPVTRVGLSGKDPAGYPALATEKTYWRWFDGARIGGPASDDPDELPPPLWDAYRAEMSRRAESWEHPTRDAALLALSRAAVGYGRALAGLPPLAEGEG